MAQEQPRNVKLTIGTTSTEVSPERNRQQEVIFRSIVNRSLGGQTITLSFGDEAKDDYGIPLAPGGFYVESKDLGYTPTNLRINASSTLAGGILSVSERVQMRQ